MEYKSLSKSLLAASDSKRNPNEYTSPSKGGKLLLFSPLNKSTPKAYYV